MRLSIIIPAHNEEHRLARTLEAYLPFFDRLYGDGFEILLMINGSSDNTQAVAGGFTRRYPQLKVIVEPRPIGKGGAIMAGFARAAGALVGFVDADGATPPEAFQELATRIGDSDAIIASRWLKGATVSPRQRPARLAASRVFNLLVRLLFGLKISDTQCGAKLLRREAVAAVLPRLGITRWAFDVDLLFQLQREGFSISEIPTVWHDVGGSRLRVGRVSLEMFAALVRLRLLYSPFRGVVSFYDRFLARLFNR